MYLKRKIIVAILGSASFLGIGYYLGHSDKVTSEALGAPPAVVEVSPMSLPASTAEKNTVTEKMSQGATVYLKDREPETKSLINHSRKVIDAFLVGTGEAAGSGDFLIRNEEVADLLTKDYNRFKILFADELNRGVQTKKEMESFIDGLFPWNKYEDQMLLRIVLAIDEAYEGAIDNLSWSNTEPATEGIDEQTEFSAIRDIDFQTRFMKARDAFQRYETWLFEGIGEVEGITRITK